MCSGGGRGRSRNTGTKRKDKVAAVRFFKNLMKVHKAFC